MQAHATSHHPLKLHEILDALVGMAGGAIALTFALAIAFFLVSFGAGTFAGIFEWLLN